MWTVKLSLENKEELDSWTSVHPMSCDFGYTEDLLSNPTLFPKAQVFSSNPDYKPGSRGGHEAHE